MARSHGVPLSVYRSWPEADRAMAEALQEYEDGLCSGCGHSMQDTFNAALQHKWLAENPVRCHACTARSRKAEQYSDAIAPEALRFPVVLRK